MGECARRSRVLWIGFRRWTQRFEGVLRFDENHPIPGPRRKRLMLLARKRVRQRRGRSFHHRFSAVLFREKPAQLPPRLLLEKRNPRLAAVQLRTHTPLAVGPSPILVPHP